MSGSVKDLRVDLRKCVTPEYVNTPPSVNSCSLSGSVNSLSGSIHSPINGVRFNDKDMPITNNIHNNTNTATSLLTKKLKSKKSIPLLKPQDSMISCKSDDDSGSDFSCSSLNSVDSKIDSDNESLNSITPNNKPILQSTNSETILTTLEHKNKIENIIKKINSKPRISQQMIRNKIIENKEKKILSQFKNNSEKIAYYFHLLNKGMGTMNNTIEEDMDIISTNDFQLWYHHKYQIKSNNKNNNNNKKNKNINIKKVKSKKNLKKKKSKKKLKISRDNNNTINDENDVDIHELNKLNGLYIDVDKINDNNDDINESLSPLSQNFQ